MKALISILFLLITNTSFAEDTRYYDVEVIVFENLSENAKNAENWPLQVNLALPEKTVQLGQPVLSEWLPEGQNIDLTSSYIELDASTFQLTRESEKLSESKSQRVILHTAWRQPGLDKNLALPVHFKREIPVMPKTELISEANSTSSEYEEDSAEARPSILEGLLRVTLARYLHLEAELTYQEKLPEVVNSNNPFSELDFESERSKIEKQGIIHLKQDRRRIRSNELHYLDHPVLGMLVRITPYEKPEEVDTEKTQKP